MSNLLLTPLYLLKMREVFILDGTLYAVMFPEPTHEEEIQCIRLAIVNKDVTGEFSFLYAPSSTFFINKFEKVQKLRMV